MRQHLRGALRQWTRVQTISTILPSGLETVEHATIPSNIQKRTSQVLEVSRTPNLHSTSTIQDEPGTVKAVMVKGTTVGSSPSLARSVKMGGGFTRVIRNRRLLTTVHGWNSGTWKIAVNSIQFQMWDYLHGFLYLSPRFGIQSLCR